MFQVKEVITARIHGQEYIISRGNLVHARTTVPNRRDKFNAVEKTDLIIFLYSKETKDEQDTYLLGLIERFNVARKAEKQRKLVFLIECLLLLIYTIYYKCLLFYVN